MPGPRALSNTRSNSVLKDIDTGNPEYAKLISRYRALHRLRERHLSKTGRISKEIKKIAENEDSPEGGY